MAQLGDWQTPKEIEAALLNGGFETTAGNFYAIVSSALQMTADIIQDRFPTDDWNIYVAQASDGDNWAVEIPTLQAVSAEERA